MTIFFLILSLLAILFMLVNRISRKIVLDELKFWGGRGCMAGIYGYRKYGIWHLGQHLGQLKKGK